MTELLLPISSLWWREIVRFYRQRDRVLGALGTPVVFWVLIGAGLGGSFTAPSGSGAAAGYQAYFFPGTALLIVLFTAIFSTISIIEDRREGFLQGVLVAPVPRAGIVLGKLLGGTTLAVSQGLLFVLLSPVIGIPLEMGKLAGVMVVLVLSGFALTGLGFCIAWRLDSTQGFHAIMNLLLMPMWLLSGAVFPAAGAPLWLRGLMAANPLTYGQAALQRVLYPGFSGAALPSLTACLGVMAVFGLGVFLVGVAQARRPSVVSR